MSRRPVRRRDLAQTPSAERLEFFKAVTSPVRQRIMAHLGSRGPANSTALAEALGESTGTTSYHLRQLAKLGFVEEDPERSRGRERWWRAVGQDIRPVHPSQLRPAERELADQWENRKIANDIRLLGRALADWRDPDSWVRASRWGTYLTEEELDRFVEEYLELINRYGHDRDTAPEGARPVAVRMFSVVDEPPPTEHQPG